jgi:hypothetical protein
MLINVLRTNKNNQLLFFCQNFKLILTNIMNITLELEGDITLTIKKKV